VVGQGAVATALIQKGTLHVGDIVVAGSQWGRVRALSDCDGNKITSATPSSPVEIVGLNGLPGAGDQLMVTPDEAKAREIAEVRQNLERERRVSQIFLSRWRQ
jgi:translation initiation factor IF-2